MSYFLLASFALTGCVGASNVGDLKSNPANKQSITVNYNYQKVYKIVKDGMYDCFGIGAISSYADYHIKNEMYSELGEAEVSFFMSNWGTQNYLLHVDIDKTQDDLTNIDVYSYLSTWKPKADEIVAWVESGKVVCE
jgi:hypothetical protein